MLCVKLLIEMHEFIFFNRRIARAADAFTPTISAAALYGRGIFTTIAVYEAKPFLWEKHWRRLQNNAKTIGIDLSDLSEATVKNALLEIIEKNRVADGRARLTFFDANSGAIWKTETARRTDLLITTADFRAVSGKLRLTVSPFSINSKSPLVNVKSCSYLENLLAFEEAKKRGFDEAVRVNQFGAVAAACLANIFWLKDEKIYTPKLETGCLAGTTREFFSENYEVSEIETNSENLKAADAIFLTSAGIGIVEACEYEGKRFASGDHEITRIIARMTSKK